MKHPYADILQAVIDCKEVQDTTGDGSYVTVKPEHVLRVISRGGGRFLRIKPATITINGADCEAPVDYPCCCVHILHPNHVAKTINFSTASARDAAYAALIKPFESTQ